jgi:adenine-specific DNA-methyltransferase
MAETTVTPGSANFGKLKVKLRELFELDKADLDFGIYRILRQRHKEITEFLDQYLERTVRDALQSHASLQTGQLEDELRKAETAAREAGFDAAQSPRVQELRAKTAAGNASLEALADEVYSQLLTFFSRYYSEGDFLGLQRSTIHGRERYVIPYNGEEVKLVWANMDQYYIKTSELLRDYSFHMRLAELPVPQLDFGGQPDEVTIQFKLVDGDTEKDNRKPAGKLMRAFSLDAEKPFEEIDNDTLAIRFRYDEHPSERDLQKKLNEDTEKTLADNLPVSWRALLFAEDPTNKGKENQIRTILQKHLRSYTAKYQFDYFIHKDLGGFLRRELDFYIKNEVMHLDDIEDQSAPKAEEYLSKIRALRQCALPIIRMLEQLENFQKRLWLKKKFAVETRYCLTLDRVPESLYSDISANDAQWDEWEQLYSLADLDPELLKPGAAARSADFLKANSSLMIDTRHFSRDFTLRLLASIDNLDQALNGICFHSENFQALQLITSRFAEQVKCVYIDPPYNTSASSIPYKNDYKHSSWGTLMRDRLEVMRETLEDDGAIFVSIDKNERTILEHAMDYVFSRDNKVEELIWVQNTNDGRSPTYSTNHEYVEVYARRKEAAENDKEMFREPKPGYDEVMALIAELGPEYPPVQAVKKALAELYEDHKREYREQVEAEGLDYRTERRNDPWKGLYSYKSAEYRDSQGRFVPENEAKSKHAQLWVWTDSDWTIMSSERKQSDTIRDPNDPNYRFYRPIHDVTKEPCNPPQRGWKGTQFIDPEHPERNSFESLLADKRIVFGKTEKKVPRQKRFLHEVEFNVSKSVFVDYSDGEKEMYALFGKAGLFLAPKHTKFVSRLIQQGARKDSTILDCFAGSGSTPHAVMKMNREDGGSRFYVAAEVAHYFETLIIPRLKKAAYSGAWRQGKPQNRGTGISHAFKIVRLESYEDALNNLRLVQTPEQEASLKNSDQHQRDEYLLSYFLDTETEGSSSLLDLERFSDPFNYKLKIATSSAGETKDTEIDLVETFNWLVGLKVKHIDAQKGFLTVTGEKRAGGRTLIIWRTLSGDPIADNEALEKYLSKLEINPSDTEFEFIYVNGSHTLNDPHEKVHLIEEEFQRRMFESESFESLS